MTLATVAALELACPGASAGDLTTLSQRALYERAAPGYGSLLFEEYPCPRSLLEANPDDLRAIGLPADAVSRLTACWEIVRRARAPRKGPSVRSPEDAAAHLLELIGDSPQEKVAVLALDAAHYPISAKVVFAGGLDRSLLDPKVLFSELLRVRAAAFVLAHNHPSGNLDPSRHDITVTDRLESAADLLDVSFLDHLIVCGDRWLSLRGLGHLEPLLGRGDRYLCGEDRAVRTARV